ncbi:Premnaspirodiene oxygenase [Platanthera zijinensis]|uniref:Premnaspirodiene oxygenase n=1 Tax=Platanthera zijinensis TaxID=2320716 RepID=A0AAP0B971_9ASPA
MLLILFILLPSILLVLLKKLPIILVLLKKLPIIFFHGRTKNTKQLPPGPWKLPFLGSIHQLLTREQAHHRFHRLSKQYGDLFCIKLGGLDFVVASNTCSARAVLNTQDHVLASRPTLLAVEIIGYNSGAIGFSPYGQYWRQLRKICTQELLSSRKVKALGFIRYEEGESLVQKIGSAGGAPVNMTEIFMAARNMLITRTAFGKESGRSRGRFLSAMKKTINLMPMLRVADLFPSMSFLISCLDGSRFQMKRLRREMDAVLDEIIEEHVMKGGDDMLVAATETTSNTMCWVMSELMRHPDISGLRYLHLVIKETLRMHPPLPLLLPRTCSEATELLGFHIPAKARVVVNAWAIGRDPESFRPERFEESTHDFKGNNYEYIPFGSGRRICPGMTFAMAEMELFFGLLLNHFD